MRGEGPFAVIRLEPVRLVAGEVGNQAVGVFLEAPHICSIFSPILQHCRGKFLVQPLGLGKALVGVDVAHLDAFLKPVHGFCGEESPLSDRQAPAPYRAPAAGRCWDSSKCLFRAEDFF